MNSVPCYSKTRSLFWTVKSCLIYTYGREPSIFELKKLAEDIHSKTNIPISREIKRSKELIICWLCDYWPIAQCYLKKMPNDYLIDPQKAIILSKCSEEKKKKLMKEYLLRDKMIEVENFLNNTFNRTKLKMNELREIAESICKKTNLKLNRNEKRDKTANLAWFVDNWDVVRPLLCIDNLNCNFSNQKETQFQKDVLNDFSEFLSSSTKAAEYQFDDEFIQNIMF